MDRRTKQAQGLEARFNKKYGDKAAVTGRGAFTSEDAIPTPILSLDYALGTGGWPRGVSIEVYGVNHLGKTALFGYGSIAQAQKQGLLTAIIAVEPDFDEDWAIKNGVDPDMNLVLRPDNGEEAFGMLKDLVEDGTCKFILFDSIGALSADKEIESDKPQAFGNSSLITWGVKRVAMRAFKNDITIMYLNQVRDNTKARIPGLVESPGGHALKHVCAIRIHIKPGGTPYTVMVNGEKMGVGRNIVASFKKNKAGSSEQASARFDWYFRDSSVAPFGVDQAGDIINVAKSTGVFSGSGWLKYEHFPDGKLNGKEKVAEFLADNPKVLDLIRTDVLAKINPDETAVMPVDLEAVEEEVAEAA